MEKEGKIKLNKKTIIIGISIAIILLAIIVIIVMINAKDEKINECEVIFDSAGGTKIETAKIVKGGVIEKPITPEKRGFTFIEWQLNGETYDFNAIIIENIILVAKYKVDEGTIIVNVGFNSNGGTDVNSIQVTQGEPITEPPIPTRENYKFDGWYLNGEKFDFSTPITKDILLSANWIEVSKETTKNGIFSNFQINNSNEQVSNNTTTTNKVKYLDVQGKWYAEGTNDVTLEFYENNGLYIMSGVGNKVNGSEGNFDIENGKIDYFSGGKGTSIYVDADGYIGRNELYLENSTKLVFSKNGNRTNFYRTANYPQHIETQIEKTVKNIIGYWYLDGYKNTYLRFYEENWYGNQSVIAETQNLNIDKNTFEILEEANYKSSYIYSRTAFGATGIYFINSLMDEQQITYSGGKLYINRNGKQYSFTRSETKRSINVEEINFFVSNTTMATRDMLIIESLEVYPGYADDKTITFSSSDTSIAYVDSSNGMHVINSKDKEGTVTITARNNVSGISKSITIDVKKVRVNGVQLNEKNIVIEKGDTKTLVATITPNNAYNKKLIWSSSNTSVVKITSGGSITAVGAGTANITVQTEDGGYTDTCTIIVKNAALNAKASIGYTVITSSVGMVDGVQVTITPSDGSGLYTYYSIKLYKDGILIKESTDTSSNQLFAEGHKNGEYTVEYIVKDSEGNTISGKSSYSISIN